jgi:CheY-like chemotaxis protein
MSSVFELQMLDPEGPRRRLLASRNFHPDVPLPPRPSVAPMRWMRLVVVEREARCASQSATLGYRSMASRRLLIADDNEDSATTLATLMALKGHAVRHATSGTEAIACAPEFGPDTVILDLGMPDLDGFATARELRKRLGDAVVMIALTGWLDEETPQLSRDAGFNHYLTKPLDTDALDRLLAVPRGAAQGPGLFPRDPTHGG